jgi:RNA polymerase sigma-70 factor, ECF subfamily
MLRIAPADNNTQSECGSTPIPFNHAGKTQELTLCCGGVTFRLVPRQTSTNVEESGEDALVARSARGDERAYALLVDRYKGMIYTTAYKLMKNSTRAEDAAQETFIKAYAALPGFQGKSKFSSWLYRICYNTCISELRKKRPEVDLEDADAVAVGGPTEEIHRRDIQTAIQTEVSALPDDYRSVITLYHFDGLAYDEIARLTHKPMGTVKATIHRARALLRTRLVERVGWDTLQEVMWR